MKNKKSVHEMLISKQKGQSVQIKTSKYSYWGRMYAYDGQTVILKPYYTNQEKDLHLHINAKELKLDEVIDVN